MLLKPAVDVSDGSYRGMINPVDRSAWFRSYVAFISHYARLAADTGVEQFSVGAELAGVSADRDQWLRVIQQVRSWYAGTLLYAANFDEYRSVAFWDALSLIGLDAYWPLAARPTTQVRTLTLAWEPIRAELKEFAAKKRRQVLFAEAGYTSQRGSTRAPSSWAVSETPDQEEQAAAYEALLASFLDESWWTGVFWWAWGVPGDEGYDYALSYTPRGKSAESVIRHWWTSPP